jgi:type VI secretion system secreted protein VgrG
MTADLRATAAFRLDALTSETTPFALRLGALPVERVRVLSFRGHERVNHPFRIDLTVCSDDPWDVEGDVLGKPATLVIRNPTSTARTLCGVISDVEQLGTVAQRRHVARLRLTPRLALLHERRTSRVFQDQSAPEIVDRVLDEAGVPRRWTVTAPYAPRTYCVQYQETDLAFVTRLLAEEGISYFFEHGDGVESGDTIVLCDSALLHPSIPGAPGLVFRAEAAGSSLTAQENQVHRFVRRHSLAPGSALVRDHDFRKPGTPLTALARTEDRTGLDPDRYRIYEHHGADERPDVDADVARTRLQQHRRKSARASGASLCPRLLPGYRFDLLDHEEEALNGSYSVRSVEHLGRAPELVGAHEPTYENTFTCVPAGIALRPARPRPRVQQVTETALVVGPPGEEIHTDEHARVKVQFPWDLLGKKDERSSCWVRVAQGWAGPGWGFQFIPRVGMEVVNVQI